MKNITLRCKKCSDQLREKFQRNNCNLKIIVGDYVKVEISEDENVEHCWFLVEKIKGENFIGKLANDPVHIKKISYGQLMAFEFKDIEDHKEVEE